MSCWRSNRASQNPSRPASKATQTRRTTRPARRDSSRQRSSNLNSFSGSGASFFSGSRARPGARAATSQLDWLISMTTINVLSGSRAARDLLRSTGLDMERSIVGVTAAMVHYFRRPPHSISPRKNGERGRPLGFQIALCTGVLAQHGRIPHAARMTYGIESLRAIGIPGRNARSSSNRKVKHNHIGQFDLQVAEKLWIVSGDSIVYHDSLDGEFVHSAQPD